MDISINVRLANNNQYEGSSSCLWKRCNFEMIRMFIPIITSCIFAKHRTPRERESKGLAGRSLTWVIRTEIRKGSCEKKKNHILENYNFEHFHFQKLSNGSRISLSSTPAPYCWASLTIGIRVTPKDMLSTRHLKRKIACSALFTADIKSAKCSAL